MLPDPYDEIIQIADVCISKALIEHNDCMMKEDYQKAEMCVFEIKYLEELKENHKLKIELKLAYDKITYLLNELNQSS